MKNIEHIFEKIKESKNPEEINDFLIKLAHNPKDESFPIIDFLIEKLDIEILERVCGRRFFAELFKRE